jgi:hypothetical protein
MVNKGINKPIEFKGLKAQYIWWLGGGILGLLFLFACMYIIGINIFVCVLIIGCLGILLFVIVYKMSNRYGEHGMMKRAAAKAIPKSLSCCSRKWLQKQLEKKSIT